MEKLIEILIKWLLELAGDLKTLLPKPEPLPVGALASDPDYLKWMFGELASGVKEIAGTEHHARILFYHQHTTYKATRDEVPWCSAFLNAAMAACNHPRTDSAAARSWLKWGKEVTTPQRGDVVIFWRGTKNGWQGHVGVFLEDKGDYVSVLGGNQSDAITIANYSKFQLLGYRRLA